MKKNRRDFLKVSAAAAVAPWIWIPKKAFAASTPGFGLAKHVLVLYAKGGMRSHCTFNAVGAPNVNPFGIGAAKTGRQWSIGGAIGSDQIQTSSLGVLPSFAEISDDVSVLACVDHNPTGSNDIDHRSSSVARAPIFQPFPIGLSAANELAAEKSESGRVFAYCPEPKPNSVGPISTGGTALRENPLE